MRTRDGGRRTLILELVPSPEAGEVRKCVPKEVREGEVREGEVREGEVRSSEEVTTASSTDTSERPALHRRAMLRSCSNLVTITIRTSQKQQVRYGDEGSTVRPALRLLQYGSASSVHTANCNFSCA